MECGLRLRMSWLAGRTKGIRGVDDMEYAILERNGGISVIEREDEENGKRKMGAKMPDGSSDSHGDGGTVQSDIPARLDRLPWAGWHWRIITALGTSWLLDGLEVTLVGSLAGVLQSPAGLKLTDPQVSAAATIYLAGAVFGALLFGYLDRQARKKAPVPGHSSPRTRLLPSVGAFLVESPVVRHLSLFHRGRYRRRVCRNQLRR